MLAFGDEADIAGRGRTDANDPEQSSRGVGATRFPGRPLRRVGRPGHRLVRDADSAAFLITQVPACCWRHRTFGTIVPLP
jgi:hypothetical protein